MTINRYVLALMTATSLLGVGAPGFATAPAAQITTQLPRNARPSHYSIKIQPDAAKMSFEGQVRIDLDILKAGPTLTFNAADLDIKSARIAGGAAAKVNLNATAQTATLTFPTALPAGQTSIEIVYSGKIYEQANGLFALDYKDPKGAQKRALFTQFEAPDARRFIPSWDEPNYKATYDLTAVVPTDQMAVSNMPIANKNDLGGGKSEVTFQRSPKMSTYLLFFGVGEFDRITKQVGNTEVGVIMGRGNADKGQYALEAAAKVVPYYNDYFGVNFPLPKLDNVAGPGQSQFFSAMENWGAIFTFERVLMLDPKITSARGKQAIFAVAGHEIAHQWFGDLVTMQWWDDLWLNEGFASWMETKATAHFNPTWEAELGRVDGREAAMGLDAYATTHPVIQHVQTVEQTSQAFDAITYQKGEAVITMLEGYAGENVWRDGIRNYMNRHAYGNTTTDDLWSEVEKTGAKGLTSIAHDFTKQPGIPMLRVTSSACQGGATTLSFTQGEFSRDRKAKTDTSKRRWHVPVIAQSLGQAPVRAIVSGGRGTMKVPGCDVVLVNAGQSGYYRTLYPTNMLGALKANYTKLASIDQLGLMNDMIQLSHGEYQPMDVALDLIGSVPATASAQLVGDALDSWGGYYARFKGDGATQSTIGNRVSRIYGPRLQELGFAPRADESAPQAILRTDLIGLLGRTGDATVLAEARRLFADLDTNPAALDGPLRETWLGVVARHASRADWDKMRKLGQTAESQQIKASMYRLLGGAKDPVLANAALDLALTEEPGKTVSSAIISAVAGEHPDMAVDFALANLKRVEEFVDVSSRSRYVGQLAGGSRDIAMIAKLNAYAKAHLTPQSRGPVDKAIASIRTRLASEPRIKAGVKDWLTRNP
jgi:aminopeptidase N